MSYRISTDLIAALNTKAAPGHEDDFASLGRSLARRGIDIEAVTATVQGFAVAVPTWGVGSGGTRFARFPGPGEPRNTAFGLTTLMRMFIGALSSVMQRARCTSAALAVQ